jgi:hypothetical protein
MFGTISVTIFQCIGTVLFIVLLIAVYRFPWRYKSQLCGNWYIFHNKSDLKAATKIWYTTDITDPTEFEKALLTANVQWDYE